MTIVSRWFLQFALLAFVATWHGQVGAQTTVVTGTATYRERIALPPDAVFEATLEDVSRADAPAEVIGQVRIDGPGNPPIRFAIGYEPARIIPNHRYSVRARIVVGGRLLFTTDRNYPVLTGGGADAVALLLRRTGSPKPIDAARSADGARPIAAGARAQALTIKGALSYRARIALPARSFAVVELRDVSIPDGAVVAERRIALDGRQVPIPFDLAVDGAKLDDSRRYALRAALFAGGRAAWSSEPVMVDRRSGAVDAGTLELTPVRVGAFATSFRCGDLRATIDFTPKALRLTVADEAFEMRRVVAASGERYEAVADPTTSFWSKGSRATLVVKGTTYPECERLDGKATSFRAKGNEPGWTLDIDGERMSVSIRNGERRLVAATPAAQRADAYTRYAARVDGTDVTATIFDRRCKDTMTGMPHPNAVEVVVGAEKFEGCGGDPATLLQGREWIVEDIAGGGVIDRSRVTLAFGADGRVAGRASCNTYTAQYTLTGETLTVSPAATTMMACVPALEEQERRFLGALRDVRRFELSDTGALVLHTADGRTLTARR